MYRRLLINICHKRNGLNHLLNGRPHPTKHTDGETYAPLFKPIGGWRSSSTSTTPPSESSSEAPPDEEANTDNKSSPSAEPAVRRKAGKEGLLEMLGAMKVEVTTKRKVRPAKIPRAGEGSEAKQMESARSMFQQATVEASHRATLSPALVAAAAAAASTMPNSRQVESELLQQLRKHEAVPDAHRRGDGQNIGEIIADMKVRKRQNVRFSARPSSQIHFDDDGKGYNEDRGIANELDSVRRRRNPFTGKRLNIFTAGAEHDESPELGPTLWDIEQANQIIQATNQMPRNGFDEMIQWTREGKLWSYPVDNEAGLEEEAAVPFHEHVFLEKHLESFPRQGPVRHFMELVIAGLAKNHQLTVQQKRQHIAWFREYFQQKDEVLKAAEA